MCWTPGMSLNDVEKKTILEAYRANHYNKYLTAQSLGVSLRTIYYRIEKYEKELGKSLKPEGYKAPSFVKDDVPPHEDQNSQPD